MARKTTTGSASKVPLAEELDLRWKVHVPNLLEEIAKHSTQGIYKIPISILRLLLGKVGERASQLNDPILNDLMCLLTIYEIANPESEAHDPAKVKEIAAIARKAQAGIQTKEGE